MSTVLEIPNVVFPPKKTKPKEMETEVEHGTLIRIYLKDCQIPFDLMVHIATLINNEKLYYLKDNKLLKYERGTLILLNALFWNSDITNLLLTIVKYLENDRNGALVDIWLDGLFLLPQPDLFLTKNYQKYRKLKQIETPSFNYDIIFNITDYTLEKYEP